MAHGAGLWKPRNQYSPEKATPEIPWQQSHINYTKQRPTVVQMQYNSYRSFKPRVAERKLGYMPFVCRIAQRALTRRKPFAQLAMGDHLTEPMTLRILIAYWEVHCHLLKEKWCVCGRLSPLRCQLNSFGRSPFGVRQICVNTYSYICVQLYLGSCYESQCNDSQAPPQRSSKAGRSICMYGRRQHVAIRNDDLSPGSDYYVNNTVTIIINIRQMLCIMQTLACPISVIRAGRVAVRYFFRDYGGTYGS